MKVIQLNKALPNLYRSWLQKAQEHESTGNTTEAIKAYEKCIKIKPTDEFLYNRIMILLRKEKKYTQELKIISAGIKAFTNYYSQASSGNSSNAIKKLSTALKKSVGLIDTKGNDIYEHPTIARFKKREDLLKKRIHKNE